ncbi:MAG TPA: hypothetical protein VFQ26_07135 [Nitrospiraceae bacterium]|nr:hypothetical protein [Nitrospiraceae bacterium]
MLRLQLLAETLTPHYSACDGLSLRLSGIVNLPAKLGSKDTGVWELAYP